MHGTQEGSKNYANFGDFFRKSLKVCYNYFLKTLQLCEISHQRKKKLMSTGHAVIFRPMVWE
jgi:hypothetical protein